MTTNVYQIFTKISQIDRAITFFGSFFQTAWIFENLKKFEA